MADVFISYSKADIEVAKALADDLTAHGFDVWWDHQLYAGDDFHDMILAEIAKAKATIVIWSATAAASRWVRGEADEAAHLNTLVSTSVPDFDPRGVPLNFRSYHCEPVENRDRIIAAIERKGASARAPETNSDEADAAPVLPAAERRPGDPETAEEIVELADRCNWVFGSEYDAAKAKRLYGIAAKMGDAKAQRELAKGYMNPQRLFARDKRDKRIIEKDLPKAVHLLKLSAQQLDGQALFLLAQLFSHGEGVSKDEPEAARLYELAVNNGWYSAGFELGQMYEEGRGVPRDIERAISFYRIASNGLSIDYMGAAKEALKRLGHEP